MGITLIIWSTAIFITRTATTATTTVRWSLPETLRGGELNSANHVAFVGPDGANAPRELHRRLAALCGPAKLIPVRIFSGSFDSSTTTRIRGLLNPKNKGPQAKARGTFSFVPTTPKFAGFAR
jgi:hypothetical protein